MHNVNLTQYDVKPEYMVNYLRYNGPHFNSKLLKFALSKMKVRNDDFVPYTKDQVDFMLKAYNIKLDNNQLLDYVYVANMAKADFIGSSISDEQHLVKYIKDVIDDFDAYDGIVFNRWYADMCYMGIVIDWEQMI